MSKITAEEIMKQIDEALRSFGEYTYEDKGAEEVMDVYSIVNSLKEMQTKEILTVLQTVEKEHKCAGRLLTAIAMSLQEWQDPRADELFESELFQEYY